MIISKFPSSVFSLAKPAISASLYTLISLETESTFFMIKSVAFFAAAASVQLAFSLKIAILCILAVPTLAFETPVKLDSTNTKISTNLQT